MRSRLEELNARLAALEQQAALQSSTDMVELVQETRRWFEDAKNSLPNTMEAMSTLTHEHEALRSELERTATQFKEYREESESRLQEAIRQQLQVLLSGSDRSDGISALRLHTTNIGAQTDQGTLQQIPAPTEEQGENGDTSSTPPALGSTITTLSSLAAPSITSDSFMAQERDTSLPTIPEQHESSSARDIRMTSPPPSSRALFSSPPPHHPNSAATLRRGVSAPPTDRITLAESSSMDTPDARITFDYHPLPSASIALPDPSTAITASVVGPTSLSTTEAETQVPTKSDCQQDESGSGSTAGRGSSEEMDISSSPVA